MTSTDPRFGLGLDPCREVRRVAEYLARGVDHDRARVEANAGRKRRRLGRRIASIEVGERALDEKACAHRAFGVVLLRLRIAEQRHQPVAELFQNMPAKSGHRARGFVEIGINKVAPVFRVKLRDETGRADEVTEHDCDRPAFGLGARRWRGRGGGGLRGRRWRVGCSRERLDRRQHHPPMPNDDNAEVLEVFSRQLRQNLAVARVLAKSGLVLAEAETSQPVSHVHGRGPEGSGA